MDKDLIIPLVKKKETFKAKLRRLFLIEKLNNPFGIILFFFISVILASAIAQFGFKIGVLAIGGMIAIPVVYSMVAFPRFGIMVYLTMAYLIMWFYKLGVEFPLGTLMDGMEALFFLSLFIDQKRDKNWSMMKGPISTMLLVWIGYNIFQVANPTTEVRIAWIYTVRGVALVAFTYFIFLYYVTTIEFVRAIFKLWIALAIFAALYAFKQEHVGFFPFEDAYLHSDPQIGLLLFIGGVWRKFSIFSDPVAFSYNMVTASMMCVGLMTCPMSNRKKGFLGFLVVFFLLVMLYSGTRGAFVLPPATMLMLTILKYNKTVLKIAAVAAVFTIGLIFMPTSNQTITRFQSAFRPSDDPSFNLRKINQKRIQPFMQSHPLGGGLGCTGEWGGRFAPGSYLANLQPDSGYVRVAVEVGWLGLLLFCTMIFTIFKVGIDNYYKIKDPELKSYSLAAILVVFALNFGNYPQEAIVQYPSNVYFYLMVAMLVITYRLDKQKTDLANVG